LTKAPLFFLPQKLFGIFWEKKLGFGAIATGLFFSKEIAAHHEGHQLLNCQPLKIIIKKRTPN